MSLKVVVRAGETVGQALRRLHKLLEKQRGIFRGKKHRREHYEKPSVLRRKRRRRVEIKLRKSGKGKYWRKKRR